MPEYKHQHHGRMLRDIHNTRTVLWDVTGPLEITIYRGYIRKDNGEYISWGYGSPYGQPIIVDASTSGLNGADSVPLEGDYNYFVYILDDGTTPYGYLSQLFGLSSVESGITSAVCIGWVRTDTSGNLIPFTSVKYFVDIHAVLDTGVHGVGSSTVESVAGSQEKVDTHAAMSQGVHGASSDDTLLHTGNSNGARMWFTRTMMEKL